MPGGYFYLQERAPGRPMRAGGVGREMDADELAVLLRLLDRHSALAPGVWHDWSKRVAEVVLHQQHEWAVVARSQLPVVQKLLEACEQRVAGLSDPALRHNDLVIGDFGPHNVLVDDEGRVTAVVDLESASRGDRVIDTVGLLYMVEPQMIGVVREAALAIVSPKALAVCGVYWIVRRLCIGIRAGDDNLRPAMGSLFETTLTKAWQV
jgi:aminoglycoside phosphotransferase (APT) family kinase protein